MLFTVAKHAVYGVVTASLLMSVAYCIVLNHSRIRRAGDTEKAAAHPVG